MDMPHSQQPAGGRAASIAFSATVNSEELTTAETMQIQHVVNEQISDEQATVMQLAQEESINDHENAISDSGESEWKGMAFKVDDSSHTFQQTIGKWEEFYDKIYAYLRNRRLPSKNAQSIEKAACSFSMDADGSLFFTKQSKTGTRYSLPVVRNYDDRLRICRAIHLETGVEGLHHRRDKMIELLGQKYYWKGQRRDACECIASCDVCSAGLGAKKRAKPPKQPRDVRPPAKLMKLMSPCHVTNNSFKKDVCEHPSGSLTSQSEFAFPGAQVDTDSLRDIVAPLEQNLSPVKVTLQETLNSSEERLALEEASAEAPRQSSLLDHLCQTLLAGDHNHQSLDILPDVADAMHKAMQFNTDPVLVMRSCESLLKQLLRIDDQHSVFITPSLAAAYIFAVSAALHSTDPLTINSRASLSPLAVIHDASSQQSTAIGSLKTCTPLTGAFNLNLGTTSMPMNKDMLAAVLHSNRVAAVFYEPYAYLAHQQPIPLETITSTCRERNVSVLVDASSMPQDLISTKFTLTVQELLSQGADAALLPETKTFKGPPNTCLVIGKSSLLEELISNGSTLKSQVALPVTCTSHDLIGTAIAYQRFLSEDSTIKT